MITIVQRQLLAMTNPSSLMGGKRKMQHARIFLTHAYYDLSNGQCSTGRKKWYVIGWA